MSLNIYKDPSIKNLNLGQGFVRPAYLENLSFAFIPSTIKSLFGLGTNLPVIKNEAIIKPKKIDQIALIFIDNFGWNHLNSHLNLFQFLGKEKHQISQITSQFPSTTTVHVTTIQTGLPVYEHGIYEWFMYHEKLDEIISPFKLNKVYEELDETLLEKYKVEDILPKRNFRAELAMGGVSSISIIPKQLIKSKYNEFYHGSTESFGYKFFSEGLTELAKNLKEKKYKYNFLYYDGLDAVSHVHSPESQHFRNELANIAFNLEKILLENNSYENTLILICADHGQVKINEDKNVYLNKQLPEIFEQSYRLKSGNLAIPLGSPRDFFLKLKNKNDFVSIKNNLVEKLGGNYLVQTYQDLVKNKIIVDTEILQARFPDIAILPQKGYSAFIEDETFALNTRGHHGGLTEDEMFTPLISVAF